MKYILGEILLIFIGISLAVWFNNWNNSNEIKKKKAIAIEKIEGEIQSNLKELIDSREKNKRIPQFMGEYKKLAFGENDAIIMTAEEMKLFQDKYSNFFKVKDSTKSTQNNYAYTGNTFINLEIASLSKIAWDTSKTTGIFGDFGFDCLYELESTYNLQKLVENEFQNAMEALQHDSIDKLLTVLEFLDQLEAQLEERYNKVLSEMESCK